MSHDLEVGKACIMNMASDIFLPEYAHLKYLSPTSMKDEVSKGLYLSRFGRVDQSDVVCVLFKFPVV